MSKKIYKFLSINEFTRDVILTEEFYFGDWEKMNDPMEGYFEYNPGETIQNNLDDLRNEKNKYGICCFSKKYDQVLMWSHYTDNHQGICIEIEIDEELCKNNNIFISEIDYVHNIENIVGRDTTLLSVIGLLCKKIKIWKYEKEIRLFCEGKNTKHKIGKIKRIFLGARFNQNNLIENYINKRDIKVVQAKINFKSNTINIK